MFESKDSIVSHIKQTLYITFMLLRSVNNIMFQIATPHN